MVPAPQIAPVLVPALAEVGGSPEPRVRATGGAARPRAKKGAGPLTASHVGNNWAERSVPLIGVFQNGMELKRTLTTCTILTIGDGPVTVIASLMVSISGGLIVTRTSSDGKVGTDAEKRIFSNPQPLLFSKSILDRLAEDNPKVIGDLVPKLLPMARVPKVFQHLVREQVSIRDSVTVLETPGEAAALTKNPVLLTEYVRQAIRRNQVKPYLHSSGNCPHSS